MVKVIKNINESEFKKYGYVVKHDFTSLENPQTSFSEACTGRWKISTLKIDEKAFTKMSKHPNTMEYFEPMEGITLLLVACSEDIMNYDVFLLDKSVCTKRDILHSLMSLSEFSVIKITENEDVITEKIEIEKVCVGVGNFVHIERA